MEDAGSWPFAPAERGEEHRSKCSPKLLPNNASQVMEEGGESGKFQLRPRGKVPPLEDDGSGEDDDGDDDGDCDDDAGDDVGL